MQISRHSCAIKQGVTNASQCTCRERPDFGRAARRTGAGAGRAGGVGGRAAISSLDKDAIAFGVRESVANMDLSPDGKHAVFVGPGPGRTSIVYIADVVAGTVKPILSAAGNPENIRWCAFASNSFIVCRYSAIIKDAALLLPASRTIALDLNGKNVHEMGQRASSFDDGIRQFDGSIIDWLPGQDDAVLMTRTFIPEGGRTGDSNISRTKKGVGVVRLNVATMKVETVEQPRINVETYMSDGRGNVRLLGIVERSSEVLLTGRVKYLYRVPGSRDWQDLVGFQKDEFSPLAIDASTNLLYALRKRDGRYALVSIALDATKAEKVVVANPRVDIDNVVRSSNGERVIGYSYTEDRSHTVYSTPNTSRCRARSARHCRTFPS